MNWFDIVFIIVLILGSALGALSGFIWQITNIIALIISIYLSVIIHKPIALWLSANNSNPFIIKISVFLLVFICIYLILFFIIWFIERSVKKSNLTVFNRVLGGILGFIKVALICGTILMGMVFYSAEDGQTTINKSFLAPYLLELTRRTVFIMPKSCQKQIKHFVKILNQAKTSKPQEPKTPTPGNDK
jgi:membrane protein required for colicin V production